MHLGILKHYCEIMAKNLSRRVLCLNSKENAKVFVDVMLRSMTINPEITIDKTITAGDRAYFEIISADPFEARGCFNDPEKVRELKEKP